MTTSNEAIAYCAAVFESKGTVYFSSGNQRAPKPRIAVQIKEKDVLERLVKEFGGNIRQRAAATDIRSAIWVWEIEGQRAVAALETMDEYFQIARSHEIVELLGTYPFSLKMGRSSREEAKTRRNEINKLVRRLPKVMKKHARPKFARRSGIEAGPTDYAYLAGFLDTRGWLRPPESHEKGTSVCEAWHRDPDLVRYLWSAFRGKVYTHKAVPGEREVSYSWRISVTPAREFMPLVLPTMVVEERKELLGHWADHKPVGPPGKAAEGVPSKWAKLFQ